VSPTIGYSGTPLAKKLGFKDGSLVLLVDAPKDYAQLVAPVPLYRPTSRRIESAN
jgi:hypothetical protein